MDVLLIFLLLGGLLYHFHSKSKSARELQTLDKLLREVLHDHERELADHKESVQELALAQTQLKALKSTSLTPENSVPKDMYVTKVLEMAAEITDLRTSLNDMTCKFEESRGKQRSEQVRIGQIGEQFSTLHDKFKYDRKETKAILQPIDLVCFEEDEVVFVEVKTGNSQLTTKQRKIRDNIRAGRVKFEIFRIDETGANWEE